jgi:sigma-B regulation protein RsbU (phosphoserine phosphatase)
MNRVLVFEADNTTRLQLEAVLTRGGFDPIAVGDADAAIAELEGDHPPMLVVMGWEVAGADGLEMLHWLRGSASRAGTWVLLLTGHSQREDEIAALDAGADDYLVKPVDSARLRAHLRAGARRVALLAGRGSSGDTPGRAAA